MLPAPSAVEGAQGAGVASARAAPCHRPIWQVPAQGSIRKGVKLLKSVLTVALAQIAFSAAAEPRD